MVLHYFSGVNRTIPDTNIPLYITTIHVYMPDIWIPWFGGYGYMKVWGYGGLGKMITSPIKNVFYSPLSSISNHYNSIQLYNQ